MESSLVLIFFCMMVFVSLVILAGVFLGGVLVYKTRYAGENFIKKHIEEPAGNAMQGLDEYPELDDLCQNEGFPDEDKAVVNAVDNMLKRNSEYMRQSANAGSFGGVQ